MKPKLKYLLASTAKFLQGKGVACPSCGRNDAAIMDRKYIVTTLRRCRYCKLLFRTPTTSPEESTVFYQEEYAQGFTTDLPNDEELRTYLETRFKGTEKDYSTQIDVLEALGCKPGLSLLDFGCSWGYGSWQLRSHGYSVEAFEISVRRADYAQKKLGMKVFSTLTDLHGLYDVFFSSHVLEHVPSVNAIIDFGLNVLRPDGLFVAFTPNGSEPRRVKDLLTWRQWWGQVHPNFLDDVYYKCRFAKYPTLVASDPYDLTTLRNWRGTNDTWVIPDLSGNELLVAVRKESR